jgi:hypothetical protein
MWAHPNKRIGAVMMQIMKKQRCAPAQLCFLPINVVFTMLDVHRTIPLLIYPKHIPHYKLDSAMFSLIASEMLHRPAG